MQPITRRAVAIIHKTYAALVEACAARTSVIDTGPLTRSAVYARPARRRRDQPSACLLAGDLGAVGRNVAHICKRSGSLDCWTVFHQVSHLKITRAKKKKRDGSVHHVELCLPGQNCGVGPPMSENMINVTGKSILCQGRLGGYQENETKQQGQKGKKREKQSETPKHELPSSCAPQPTPPLIPRKPP